MTGIGHFIKPTAIKNGGYLLQNSTRSGYNHVFTVGNEVCLFNIIISWAVCGAVY